MFICKYKYVNKIKVNYSTIKNFESFRLNLLNIENDTEKEEIKTCRSVNQELIDKKIIEIGNRYAYNIKIKNIHLIDTLLKSQIYFKFDNTCILLEFDMKGFKLEKHIRIPKICDKNELNTMILKFYYQQYSPEVIAYLLDIDKSYVYNSILSKKIN